MSDKLVTYAAGFKAGATAMREAAAKELERFFDSDGLGPSSVIVARFRALPLPEPK